MKTAINNVKPLNEELLIKTIASFVSADYVTKRMFYAMRLAYNAETMAYNLRHYTVGSSALNGHSTRSQMWKIVDCGPEYFDERATAQFARAWNSFRELNKIAKERFGEEIQTVFFEAKEVQGPDGRVRRLVSDEDIHFFIDALDDALMQYGIDVCGTTSIERLLEEIVQLDTVIDFTGTMDSDEYGKYIRTAAEEAFGHRKSNHRDSGRESQKADNAQMGQGEKPQVV